MKPRILILLVVVAAIVGLWWLLSSRSAPPQRSPEASGAAEPGLDRQAIIARKMKARRGGEIDLSPARATGRVTDAEGTGVTGAVVLLTPKGLEQRSRAMTPGESARPLQARTDADGQWSMPGVPPGRYSLAAAAVGHLPATRDVTLVAGRDNAGLDLSLLAGGHALQGTVADIGGGPVEDVLVRITRLDEVSPFNFDRPALGIATDEEGRFGLQLADGQYSLATFHPDYVDAQQTLQIDGGPRTVALTITPAGTIEGRVVARGTGQPVEGAIVSRSGEIPGGFVVNGIGDDQVVSDAEGRFTLRGLGSGVFRLGAVARGYATRQPVEVVLGVAEQVSAVEIVVDPAMTLAGFVVARGDEERGLEGVLVGAYSFQPGRLYAAASPSASDGYFEIFGVMPGGYMVGAVGEDALPNFMGTGVEVKDQDVRDVLVVMDAGVRLRGRVSPAVSARISVSVDTDGMSVSTMLPSMSNMLVRARTDDEGSFALYPVAPGELTLVAEADDGSRGELRVDVSEADLDGLVIDLKPRASVRGQVIDAHGDPAAGLTVALVRKDAKGRGMLSAGAAGTGLGGHETATTDEHGNFGVKGLDAGDYDITVSTARGPSLEWAQPEQPERPRAPIVVSLGEGEQRRGLVLAVEARDGVITGVVVGPQGQPVADAWVTALRNESAAEWSEGMRAATRTPDAIDDQPQQAARDRQLQQWEMTMFAEPPVLTDAAGRFEIRGLRTGVYRLRGEAHAQGARGFVEDVALGSDVQLPLQPLASLEGVVRSGGAPVQEYTVEVRGVANRSLQVVSPQGRFSMTRLDAGDYEVIARSSEGTARAEVELHEGATASASLEIGGWGSLRGTVVDATTGDPIPDLSITVLGDTGPAAGAMMGMFTGLGPKTDEDGVFRVDEVPPGEGQIMFLDRDATGMSAVVASADYLVEPEQEEDLGTITGVAPSYIEPEDRGTLGLQVTVATYAQRPRAPEAVDDEDEALIDQTARLWVSHVTPGGGAAVEGIVPGDEVVAVDGTAVVRMGAQNAARLLSPRYVKVGEQVEVEIVHGGNHHLAPITAQMRPAGG